MAARLILLLVLFLVPALAAHGQPARRVNDASRGSQSSPSSRSLSQRLLDELQTDLLEGLDDLPPPAARPTDARDLKPPGAAADDADTELLEQLGEGEDVELGQPSDPLTRVGRKMLTVEQLMQRSRLSSKTQRLQKEIVDDLAALIRLQKPRCGPGACGAPPNSRQKPASGSQKAGGSAARGGPVRPRQSTPRIGKSDARGGKIQPQSDVFKEIWGRLPARLLQQLRSGGFEQFLPKYEKLIEDYYKRLAESDKNYP